jgi:Xaa-Pro aminopeptidase
MKGKAVLADPATAASAIFDRLHKAGAKIKHGADPCQLPKACKNSLEIEGTRKAHIRDGAALARFFNWFESNAITGELTEIDVAQSLEGFRRATGVLSDVSFDTISGAGPNGAIVHYRVTNRPTARSRRARCSWSTAARNIPTAPPTSPAP